MKINGFRRGFYVIFSDRSIEVFSFWGLEKGTFRAEDVEFIYMGGGETVQIKTTGESFYIPLLWYKQQNRVQVTKKLRELAVNAQLDERFIKISEGMNLWTGR